jgi:hypothetical protein
MVYVASHLVWCVLTAFACRFSREADFDDCTATTAASTVQCRAVPCRALLCRAACKRRDLTGRLDLLRKQTNHKV